MDKIHRHVLARGGLFGTPRFSPSPFFLMPAGMALVVAGGRNELKSKPNFGREVRTGCPKIAYVATGPRIRQRNTFGAPCIVSS